MLIPLAAGLALLIGISLGLLGGGGSVLTVPIFVYVLGLDSKSAIATSLLVVGITSAVAALQHARAGNVRWRVALTFSAAGMVGAFAGGRVAEFIPDAILLTLFAVMMLAAAVAMWRGRKLSGKSGEPRFSTALILGEGVVVGFLTGLVGAGGGFMVVPALALLSGLPMAQAIGCSLVVIAFKSMAGFAGYASHVSVDYKLAAIVTAFAIVGTFAGTFVAKRAPQEILRKGFAVFVLLLGGYIFYREAPLEMLAPLFTSQVWPFWVGGLAIGLFVLVFLVFGGKPLGVSTGYQDACATVGDPSARRSWRLPFMLGIVGGGVISAALAGGVELTAVMGMFDTVLSSSLAVKAGLFSAGGILLGFGARLAGGCTSGHSITGIAQLAPSSIVATVGFMMAGVVVANVMFRFIAA